MFALPGLLALIFFEYLRPQEYFTELGSLPLLHIATATATLGFVVDLRLGLSRLRAAPHLVPTLLFFAWCLVTLAVRAPGDLLPRAMALAIPLAIYLLVAHGIQSFRMLQTICVFVLALALLLAAFGVHQALAPYGCHRVAVVDGDVKYVHDGRPCVPEERIQCEGEGAEPGADYVCEKAGLLGTSSIHGRVRWRGTMEDPNELALVLCMALPFAFALYNRRPSVARLLVLAVAFAGIGWCAYFTRSRGGQLVFLGVLAVYFIRQFGAARGFAVGLVIALPLLLFGGRSGASADASAMQRTEAWWVGLHLLTASPGFGVGSGQFVEHHYLTAHSTFVLAAAELGMVGLLLWTSIAYLAVKIPIHALRAEAQPVTRSWALAFVASLGGMYVGIMFLSFLYKNILWLFVGLTGVLYQAIRRHDPDFSVALDARDLVIIAGIDLAILFALVGYTGLKMGW